PPPAPFPTRRSSDLASIEQRLGASDLARKLGGERRARFGDCPCHLGIGRNRIGEQGNKLVAEILDRSIPHIEIQARQEFAVAARSEEHTSELQSQSN